MLDSQSDNVADGHTCSHLEQEFKDRLAAMKDWHETGCEFLSDAAFDRIPDFRISTQKNAHLYYSKDMDDRNVFYAYLVLRPEEKSLDLLETPHTKFWGMPVTNAGRLFGPRLDALLSELHGKYIWAIPQPDGYSLTAKTPAVFFSRLLDLIREVHTQETGTCGARGM
jgi:hypothetical protein